MENMMQTRRHSAAPRIKPSLTPKAEALYQSLSVADDNLNHIPTTVKQLSKLYKQVIQHGAEHLEVRIKQDRLNLSHGQYQTTLNIFNKFLVWKHLPYEDIHLLNALQIPEARQLEKYLQFRQERAVYLKAVKTFLINLDVSVTILQIEACRRQEVKERNNLFSKSGNDILPLEIAKIDQLLDAIRNAPDEPIGYEPADRMKTQKLLDLYLKIIRVLCNVDFTSKSLHKNVAAFFIQELDNMRMLTFKPAIASAENITMAAPSL
jgi:hypothetical protein